MLRDERRFSSLELDVDHVERTVRFAHLRVLTHEGRNAASDFALVDRVGPFGSAMRRSALTFVLEGRGRFDEDDRRLYLDAGDLSMSDQARRGLESYAGTASRVLSIDWDADHLGARVEGPVAVARLSAIDQVRVNRLAERVVGQRPREAIVELFDLLRALGVIAPAIDSGALGPDANDADRALHAAIVGALQDLGSSPAIEDVAGSLGWNARRVHRRFEALAERYQLMWRTWREALRTARAARAIRVLASPRATTEAVARFAGFRSPAALCHAFASAGLPSPGVLARAAREHPVESWSTFAPLSPPK